MRKNSKTVETLIGIRLDYREINFNDYYFHGLQICEFLTNTIASTDLQSVPNLSYSFSTSIF